MSPTVFKWRGYRFFFFSREEPRPHVHICCSDGEAKFWLEPAIALAQNQGLTQQQVRAVQAVVEGHFDEIRGAWEKHFGR